MRTLYRPVSVVLALVAISGPAVASTWSVRLDDSTTYTTSIERTSSGDIVASSPYRQSPGTLVFALNPYGDVIWSSLLSLSGVYGSSSAIVRPSADGGLCVATSFYPFNEGSSAWLAKLDATGAIVWQRTWTGGAGGVTTNDVVAAADGGCVLVGSVFAANELKLWVLRADAGGSTVWSNTISNAGVSGVRALALANGDLLAMATSTSSGAGVATLVVRLRPDGSIVWQRTLNGPAIVRLTALATTASGDILLGGTLGNRGQGAGQSGALLVRLNAQGALLGSRLYRGPYEINGIVATANGGIALVGNIFNVADRFPQFEDGFVIVTDATGAPVFATVHGGPGQDGLNAIIESGDGGFLTAGMGSPSADLGPRTLVEKLDAYGLLGAPCDRIAPIVVDSDARPITSRPSSAVIASFAPPSSSFLVTSAVIHIAPSSLVCAAP